MASCKLPRSFQSRVKKYTWLFACLVAVGLYLVVQLGTGLGYTYHPLDQDDIMILNELTPTRQAPTPRQKSNPLDWEVTKNGIPVPSYKSLVQDGNVTGDVQFLIDFVVAGFSKCGTSSLSALLSNHPQVQLPSEERYDLIKHEAPALVKRMHRLYRKHATRRYMQGYKQPKDITFPQTIEALNRHWPKTKLLVTVRHPVHWFQSFWNFFRLDLRKMNPGVGDMIGRKVALGVWEFGVHTGLGEFHLYLSRLGKTDQTADPEEWALLKDFYHADEMHLAPAPYVPHKVFFLEMSQLADKNETRSTSLRTDLQEFLGLQEPFAPVVHVRPMKKKITKEKRDRLGMDICLVEYDALRAELMRIARAASVWIRRYFLESNDVTVSSREFLEKSLAKWMFDPCDNSTTAAL